MFLVYLIPLEFKYSATKAGIVEIGALFYDENGRVIGIECDKLYDLLSGQTRSFDISTIMGQADAVKNAKKYSVNAIEYTFVW